MEIQGQMGGTNFASCNTAMQTHGATSYIIYACCAPHIDVLLRSGDCLHGTTCEVCSVTCRKLLSLLPVDIARQNRGTLRRSDPSFGTGLAFSEFFDSVPSFPQGGRFRRKLSEKKLRAPSPPSVSAASFACTPQRPMEI